MKRLLAGIFALGIAPAMAADLPYKAAPMPVAAPIQTWTGLYLGLNGGGAWSRNCWDMNGALVFGFSPSLAEGCNNASGGVVGGQIGYRQQIGALVFGIEGQGDWANLTGSNQSTVLTSAAAAFPNSKIPAALSKLGVSLVNTSKVDAIGMFTGQVGYSFGPTLLWYIKGGAAVTDNKYDGALSVPAFGRLATGLTATDHADAVKFGGVVGTGLEWMFADGWSVGAEYNHLFMGSRNVGLALTGSNPTTPVAPLLSAGMPTRNDRISQDIDMATLRLNYRFGAH
jgi:outer membrane immunogenic protein